jgi:integrase
MWIVQCRHLGKTVRLTLGRVGTLPLEGPAQAPGARDLAMSALNAARRGEDPHIPIRQRKKPQGISVGDLWAAYAEAGYPRIRGTGRKRASTINADIKRYEKHLAPIAHQPLAAIDTAAMRRRLDKIATQGQRNQVLVLFKSLRSFAVSRGLAEHLPPIAITATKSCEVQNYYGAAELRHIDEALVSLAHEEPGWRLSFAAIRVLLATGARRGEVLSLRWRDVDLNQGVARLVRDKTSDTGRDVLLPPAAIAVLIELPRTTSPYVFPSRSKSGHITSVARAWTMAVERAGVKRARLHDLRHSFASTAIAEGVSLYVVGKLLGHRQAATSQRYAHLERDAAREALDKVAGALSRKRPRLKAVS